MNYPTVEAEGGKLQVIFSGMEILQVLPDRNKYWGENLKVHNWKWFWSRAIAAKTTEAGKI